MGSKRTLMPWSEVAKKVGLSESVTRQHATNALRKMRLAMRIQELAEEGLNKHAILAICVQEAIVPAKSPHWIRGFIAGTLGISNAN